MTEALTLAIEGLPIVEAVGRTDHIGASRLLAERLSTPAAFVTLTGETSSGKSTLVNGLLAFELMPVAVRPTTGAVVHIRHAGEPSFHAIDREGVMEPLTRDDFRVLSSRPDKDLLRLRAELPATPTGWNIFDTPGFNAILAEHEEVLRCFLPDSDVVLFIVDYRTGFGQPEQDLLDLVQSSTADVADLPVILVVNRAPVGVTDDARIREVLSATTDSLRRIPTLVVVPTMGRLEAATPKLPEVSALREAIQEVIEDPARLAQIGAHLRAMLVGLWRDVIDDVERRMLVGSLDDSEKAILQAQLADIKRAQQRCHKAIDRYTKRMSKQVVGIVEVRTTELKRTIHNDIDDSGRWTGRELAGEWVEIHAIPFGVRQISAEVERYIAAELEALDREIEEIANTAVASITERAAVASDVIKKLAFNVQRTILQRVGGAGATAAFKAFGGVGGAAAGAGNIVKMVVKRGGKLVGKKFSREVYNWIGRTFTKRFLARATFAMGVALELGVFVWESHTWQRNLKAKVSKALDDWSSDVKASVVGQQLDKIRKYNHDGVDHIFEDLAESLKPRAPMPAEEATHLESHRQQLMSLIVRLEEANG